MPPILATQAEAVYQVFQVRVWTVFVTAKSRNPLLHDLTGHACSLSHWHYTSDTCRRVKPSGYAQVIQKRWSEHMPFPQRHERRDFRYPLHLPVLIKTAQRKQVQARSENISLGGILLTSSFLIPEGSAVEVAIGVEHMPDPGILLNARGKVLRVQPKDTGDFAVAIKMEEGFKLPLSDDSRSNVADKKKSLPASRRSLLPPTTWIHPVPTWHTET